MPASDSRFRRILIIDDNPSIHDDFRKILCEVPCDASLDSMDAVLFDEPLPQVRSDRYEIDSALQGEEGFDKLRRAVEQGEPYGVAFIDVRMPPGWDGIETTERLWAVDPNLQVVICTAYSDYSWPQMTSRIGETDRLLLLKKPFDNIEVLQLASTLSQKRRLAHMAELRAGELQELVEERTAALRIMAETDPLTRLPNRSVFLASLNECIDERRTSRCGRDAVLFLDLDNFKQVNDSLGHGAGDTMLMHVADRLRNCTRSNDPLFPKDSVTSARMGGDEFAVLVRNLSSDQHALDIAQRMVDQIRAPMTVAGKQMQVSTSVGIAILDDASEDAEDVLKKSDTAMYVSKSAGKNQVSLFDVAMQQRGVSRVSVELEIQDALDRHDFELFYQPIVALDSMQTVGFEALLRWIGEDGRLRSPEDFIPVAEETGQILQLGSWVIEKAVELTASLRFDWQRGGNTVRVAVNVSRHQLVRPGFVDSVRQTLERHHLAGNCLSFEVTESTLAQNASPVSEVLQQLREMGIQIYLDDFGTGYSSLSCIHRYPIDVLKIDQSFVSGEAENRQAIIEALLVLAKAMGIKVIAEGIEDAAQLAMLQQLGCPYGQGFFLGRPAPACQWFGHT